MRFGVAVQVVRADVERWANPEGPLPVRELDFDLMDVFGGIIPRPLGSALKVEVGKSWVQIMTSSRFVPQANFMTLRGIRGLHPG